MVKEYILISLFIMTCASAADLGQTGPYAVKTYSGSFSNSRGTYPMTVYYPTTGSNHPAVIFAPGLGGTKDSGDYPEWGQLLASHGYIALLFTPPTVASMDITERVDGFKSAADYLTEQNSGTGVLKGKVDVTKFGASGHSYGGGATVIILGEDSRFKAGIGLAPYTEAVSKSKCAMVTKPIKLMMGSCDTLSKTSTAQSCIDAMPSETEKELYSSPCASCSGLSCHNSFAYHPTSVMKEEYMSWFETYLKGSTPTETECSNSQDDDGDGKVDMADTGCTSTSDTDESNCGDSACEGTETCTSCAQDCLGSGQVCCSGQAYTGNCCTDNDCSETCTNYQCTEPKEPANLCDGLQLLLHLDQNSADSSGNSNGGTAAGVSYEAGKFGQAASFDGNSYITTALQGDEFSRVTFSAWFRPGSSAGNNYLAQRFITLPDSASSSALALGINNNRLASYWDDGSHNTEEGSTPLSVGTWYHGVLTYDQSSIKLYLNGNEDYSAQENNVRSGSSDRILIGQMDGQRFFTGVLDEVAVWNRALTASEIQQLANGAIVCGNPADTNNNNTIETSELMTFMEKWRAGSVSMFDILSIIKFWKRG